MRKGGATGAYIHGSEAEEQGRLSRLNALINVPLLRELRLDGQPGTAQRVLDVGSGLGQFTREITRTAGLGARVVGVEREARQLAEAVRLAGVDGEAGLVEFRQGDAFDLPLRAEEWGSFDLAHTRFLLEHVPDPLRAVRGMVRAVRPGGRVVLADDDHDLLRVWPEAPALMTLWGAYIRTYERLGNDPYVGRKLVHLLHSAGARPVRSTQVHFGGCAGDPSFGVIVDNVAVILDGARGAILGAGLLDGARIDAGLTALRAWGARPDAALWYTICWAEGVRPAAP